MRENSGGEAQALVSGQNLQKLKEPVTSENLPKNVSMQLFGLMTEVVKEKVTLGTVRAACQCAQEIHRMLKLNEEIRRGIHRGQAG